MFTKTLLVSLFFASTVACKGGTSADDVEVAEIRLSWSEDELVRNLPDAGFVCGDDWYISRSVAERARMIGLRVPEADKERIRSCKRFCGGSAGAEADLDPAVIARFWRGRLMQVKRTVCPSETATLGYAQKLYEERLGVKLEIRPGFASQTFSDLHGFSAPLDRGQLIAVGMTTFQFRDDPAVARLIAIEWRDESAGQEIDAAIAERQRANGTRGQTQFGL